MGFKWKMSGPSALLFIQLVVDYSIAVSINFLFIVSRGCVELFVESVG